MVNYMKKNLLWKIILVIYALNLFAKDPKHGWLRTEGPYLVNEKGNIVQLRGLSFYWSRPDWPGAAYYNEGTLNTLVDKWKCTVVRVANASMNGWDKCEVVLNAAINRGIYVIIDWHSHNAHAEQSQAISFFTEQANKYKNTPNVIFEPYNEPIVVDGDQKDGSTSAAVKTWKAIKPYLTNVTKAIRGTGAKNLIIIGTPYYCQHPQVAATDPIVDDQGKPYENVCYAFHFYAASHGPNAYYVKNRNDNTGGMEPSYLEAALGRVPIFISEWGTTHHDGGQGSNTYVDEANTDWWFKNYVNGKYKLSWCNWSASNVDASGAFAGSADNPSPSGKIVQRLLNESVDEWEPEWKTGLTGPAKDTVFNMPVSFHPAASFNRFYGAHAETVTVPYAYRDKEDRRIPGTLGYVVLKITPATEANWVAYFINSSSATKYICLRYHGKDGKGDIDFYVDDKKAGQVSLTSSESWNYAIAAVDIPTGKHTLKFDFKNTTGTAYYIEWFELKNEQKCTSTSSYSRNVVYGPSIKEPQAYSKNGNLIIALPEFRSYHTLCLIDVGGRVIERRNIKGIENNSFVLKNLIPGIYFIRVVSDKEEFVKSIIHSNLKK